MNLSNYFWYFKSALTPRFCDEVIKYALEKKDTMALTGDQGINRNLKKKPLNKEEVRNLKYKRKTLFIFHSNSINIYHTSWHGDHSLLKSK